VSPKLDNNVDIAFRKGNCIKQKWHDLLVATNRIFLLSQSFGVKKFMFFIKPPCFKNEYFNLGYLCGMKIKIIGSSILIVRTTKKTTYLHNKEIP
jgi:hypothetical protein